MTRNLNNKTKQTLKFCKKLISVFIVILFCVSCQQDKPINKKDVSGPLLKKLTPADTKVGFRNTLNETLEFNFVNYLNMYNGGGVALGDINNDGLLDIYFTSNQNSNKLYLNKGNMVFEDITNASGTSDSKGWSTGVTMVDINNDGLLDIYVCKSASMNNPELRKNKLFVNQGKNKFVEQAAQYGLDENSYSNQSYFFDYDNDGDLDMYLVNHRIDWVNTTRMSAEVQRNIIPEFSDKFYRNDGNKFTNVTGQAGIINKTWGHSAAINDFNGDGWLDVFVCNDFLEPDHLWINNQNGGFTDEILNYFDHISYYSMGSDVADINNDSETDLIVLDMVPEDHVRSKRNMPGMSSEQFHTMVSVGYHHQYMANMLQVKRGPNNYSEVAHLAGVAKTDWSWAPVFVDFDNDGYKDLFITNGIKRDMTDNDYKAELSALNASGKMTLEDVFAIAPGTKVKNYIYKNKGDGTFEKKMADWGCNENINSNGVAYGDLDNDGDNDLVINNLEDFASIYQNTNNNNFLKLQLNGSPLNRFGIGAKITIETGDETQYYEQFVSRGILSSVSPDPVIGLGEYDKVDRLEILWPDGKSQVLENLNANKTVKLDYKNAASGQLTKKPKPALMTEIAVADLNLSYKHTENPYNDFASEILLPHKLSTLGPKISQGDVNGDGLSDFYLSGARGTSGALLLQDGQGKFTSTSASTWEADKQYEDIGSVFFDADNDGDEDLYIVSGSNEADISKSQLQDRLYLNDGTGNFKRAANNLPEITNSGSVVRTADYDNDGDMDLFVGGRVVPGQYPLPANSYLLENNNGRFTDVTQSKAQELNKLGLVTDARFSDYDSDGDLDLMVVGEWMPLVIFDNNDSNFSKKELGDVTGHGWWYSLNASDLDGDGDDDYILGNLGLNNKFGAKKEKPFHVFCNDFDGTGNLDIVLSKESKGTLLPVRGRECSSQQMPFIAEKFPTFNSFAEADLEKIYGEEKLSEALHYEANNFETSVLINDGNGNFTLKALPVQAQYGPTQATVVIDINKDGHKDIVGAGSIYNAEVETIRYDGSKGYVLLGDGTGGFKGINNPEFLTRGNVKDVVLYSFGDRHRLIVATNNGPLQIFEI